MQAFLDQIARRYSESLKLERTQADKKQLQEMQSLLEGWADKITEKTKDLINESKSSVVRPPNGVEAAVEDIKDRQTKMIEV